MKFSANVLQEGEVPQDMSDAKIITMYKNKAELTRNFQVKIIADK